MKFLFHADKIENKWFATCNGLDGNMSADSLYELCRDIWVFMPPAVQIEMLLPGTDEAKIYFLNVSNAEDSVVQ